MSNIPSIETIEGVEPWAEYRDRLPSVRAIGQLAAYNWETFLRAHEAARKSGITDNGRLVRAMSSADLSDLQATHFTDLIAGRLGIDPRVIIGRKPLRIYASHVNPPTGSATVMAYQTTQMQGDLRIASTNLEVEADAIRGFVNVRTLLGAPLEGRANMVRVPGALDALLADAADVRAAHVAYYKNSRP